jgi:hypothetical protein
MGYEIYGLRADSSAVHAPEQHLDVPLMTRSLTL